MRRRCLGACGRMIPKGTYCKACNPYDAGYRKDRRELLDRDRRCHCAGCRVCNGQPCKRIATTVDHRTPVSRGGTNNASNLQSMCHQCNTSKAGKT